MATETIDTFVLNGREFLVLWKESATYLRGDGRMWWHAAGLDRDDAIHLCRIQAELLVLQERNQEIRLLDLLFTQPVKPEVTEILDDYERFEINAADGKAHRAVWAPFNHNTYVKHGRRWHFAGHSASRDAAKALAQDKLQQLATLSLHIRLKKWLAQICS